MKLNTLFLLIGCTLLFIIIPVNAGFLDDGSCETRTTCNFTINVVNETTGNGIDDAFCNMTIQSPTGVSIGEFEMDNLSNSGFYANNLSFVQTGKYPSDCFCQFDDQTTITDVADCTFIVGTPQNYNRILHFLIILFPVGLIALTKLTDNLMFATLGAFSLIVSGIMIFTNNFPFLEFDSSLTLSAFALITFGLGLYFLGLLIQEYWFGVQDT